MHKSAKPDTDSLKSVKLHHITTTSTETRSSYYIQTSKCPQFLLFKCKPLSQLSPVDQCIIELSWLNSRYCTLISQYDRRRITEPRKMFQKRYVSPVNHCASLFPSQYWNLGKKMTLFTLQHNGTSLFNTSDCSQVWREDQNFMHTY